MLGAWVTGGAQGLLEVMASGPTAPAHSDVHASAAAVLGYHAFNILWIGALVAVIAVRYNWKNDPRGYWANMLLAGLMDAGLVVFMLSPGIIAWTDGMIGLTLFGIGAGFLTHARFATAATAAELASA
jgi:hypothetical protein